MRHSILDSGSWDESWIPLQLLSIAFFQFQRGHTVNNFLCRTRLGKAVKLEFWKKNCKFIIRRQTHKYLVAFPVVLKPQAAQCKGNFVMKGQDRRVADLDKNVRVVRCCTFVEGTDEFRT